MRQVILIPDETSGYVVEVLSPLIRLWRIPITATDVTITPYPHEFYPLDALTAND